MAWSARHLVWYPPRPRGLTADWRAVPKQMALCCNRCSDRLRDLSELELHPTRVVLSPVLVQMVDQGPHASGCRLWRVARQCSKRRPDTSGAPGLVVAVAVHHRTVPAPSDRVAAVPDPTSIIQVVVALSEGEVQQFFSFDRLSERIDHGASVPADRSETPSSSIRQMHYVVFNAERRRF